MKTKNQTHSNLPDEIGRVSIFPITQATTATFADLYFRLTFFFFIQRGEKYVETPTQGEMIGREGDLMIFPPGAAGVFSFMLSSLFVTQSVAGWIADLDVNRWVLMGIINVFLLVAGFFLPPVAVILMSAPILLPIITTAGFDPIWFAVILTINMEIGLITPPVGLNLYVINGIAPDISLKKILFGSMPFVGCMVLAIVILCAFPGLATWLPGYLMGPAL